MQAANVGASMLRKGSKVIRFARHGCTNRPFYHIVVMEERWNQHLPVIEQIGTFDPLPNERNEKLVSFNFERLRYWIGLGAKISVPVSELLGLAGFLPIHPHTYMTAWRNRAAQVKPESSEEKEKVIN